MDFRKIVALGAFFAGWFLAPMVSRAGDHFPHNFRQVVFGCYCEDAAKFREFAVAAKKLGATHVTITAEDLPIAYWELAPPGDPYPAWVITNPGLLKIAPPEKLKSHIPPEHGRQVMDILESRCRILRELGLKAAFHTFEPQMLPEDVFAEHPDWRGPRVDHPQRSRTPRYAPSMTHPEVRDLYTQSMTAILKKCPEIEIVQMRTNDSGAGLEWSTRLYAGPSGNPRFQATPMPERIRGFFQALQAAAAARGAELHLHLYNANDSQQREILPVLGPNMAVDNAEGPEGKPFNNEVGSLLYYRRPFAPAAGIPWPITFLEGLDKANAKPAKRLFVNIGDRHNLPLYLEIFEQFARQPSQSSKSRLERLHRVAAGQVGEENAGELVNVWQALKRVEDSIPPISSGGSVFILGGVHQRWITRPFVPRPEALKAEEKQYYRPFLFQARTEANADDLMDLQAVRLPERLGGYAKLLGRLKTMQTKHAEATIAVDRLRNKLGKNRRDPYDLLFQRLHVFQCLVKNAAHAVQYQQLLDEAKAQQDLSPRSKAKPLDERLALVAENEIENTRRLIELLRADSNCLLMDRANKPQQEYQRLLGPDILRQLQKKITIMQAHRNDALPAASGKSTAETKGSSR